jgi:hypothetical protein
VTSTTVKFCAEQTRVCPIANGGPHTCTEELLNHTRRLHECECGHVWGPALAGALNITNYRMWSEHIAARAEKVGISGSGQCWQVSWMPEPVDRNQAITALSIADMIAAADNGGAAGDLTPGTKRRTLINSLCDELGLKSDDAIRMVRIDQACTSGFVTLSVRDAAGEWQRKTHVRSEHLVDESGNSNDLAEVVDKLWDDAYAVDLGVEIGTPVLIALVDAFGTPAVQYEIPARAVADPHPQQP